MEHSTRMLRQRLYLNTSYSSDQGKELSLVNVLIPERTVLKPPKTTR